MLKNFTMLCIKYNNKINSLNTNDKEWPDYKNLRLSDYQYLSEEEQEEQEEQKPKKDDAIALNKRVINEETDINEELFKKHFNFQRPSDMLVHLNKTNDTEKNNKLVNLIDSGLKDLKKEVKKMPGVEIKNETQN